VPTPFALDVLQRTLGGAVRLAELEDRTVVRTAERPDHRAGNALHLHDVPTVEVLRDAIEDAARRFDGRVRVVAPLPADGSPFDAELLAAGEAVGAVVRADHLLTHDDPVAWVEATQMRQDLELEAPGDPRAWHGVTVLHRHAGPAEDPAATPGPERGRGADDERLRWWVDGLADLAATGRARVLVARRHGTPVGSGVLVWDPRIDVGPAHAGLAVLTDVVVHPAHRRVGVGRTVAAALVGAHLPDFPRARVAAVLPGPIADAPRRHGWRTTARLLVVER